MRRNVDDNSTSRVLLRLIPYLGEGDILFWFFEGTSKQIELLYSELKQYKGSLEPPGL